MAGGKWGHWLSVAPVDADDAVSLSARRIYPHLHDRANQEAAWQAVVKVSGVDFSSAAP